MANPVSDLPGAGGTSSDPTRTLAGAPSPPPPPPSAPPTTGGAPTISTSGEAATLDVNNQFAASVVHTLPGSEIAYAEITSTVSSTTATEASPLDVVAAATSYFDGSPIWVEFYSPSIGNGGAANGGFNVWEDSTDKGRLFDTNGATVSFGGVFRKRVTPTQGYHTYKIRLWTAGGTTFQTTAGAGGAGTRSPAFIRITKA